MKFTVHPETYTAPAAGEYTGSVEISIGSDRRRVAALAHGETIEVYGLAIRYPTGTKVWRGVATYWTTTGNTNRLRGPIDHRARFERLHLVGFYADFEGKPVASKI